MKLYKVTEEMIAPQAIETSQLPDNCWRFLSEADAWKQLERLHDDAVSRCQKELDEATSELYATAQEQERFEANYAAWLVKQEAVTPSPLPCEGGAGEE